MIDTTDPKHDDEIVTVPVNWLRDGRLHVYFDDLRVLAVDSTLDEAGRRRALDEVTR